MIGLALDERKNDPGRRRNSDSVPNFDSKLVPPKIFDIKLHWITLVKSIFLENSANRFKR